MIINQKDPISYSMAINSTVEIVCASLIEPAMSKPLKVLNDEDLKHLRTIYSQQIPYASHVLSLIDNYFLSKSKHPDKDYMVFLALENDWKTNGTFLMKFSHYDLFTFSLDKSGGQIYDLLQKTNVITPNNHTICYGIRNEHLPPLYKALEHHQIPVKQAVECWFYWLPKEKALQYTIECPEEVYLSKLDKSHAELVASHWPHTFDGADRYISLLLEMNGGYGVFLKDGDKPVSWILKTHWGTLVVLETLPEYKRKGYGTLVTKKLCKEIAEEGINPLCTIVVGNTVSRAVFEKLGFQHIDNCTFLVL